MAMQSFFSPPMRCGLGMGIASHPLVEEDLRSGRLVAPFGFTATGRSYCMMHARTLADSPKIAAFRSWITGLASASAL